MKKIIASILASVSALTPLVALAQTIKNIDDVAVKASNIGNLLIGLAISLAVVWIIINIVRYLIATNDPAKRKEGGLGILFGVVGLFVILSVWGLVAILRNSFVTDNVRPDQPTIPIPGSTNNNGSSDLIPGVNTGY